MDRDLTIRVLALYVPIAAAVGCWIHRPPTRRALGGVILAISWNVALLVPLQFLAARLGWWSFPVSPGARLPFPVELIAGWAIAWGALPILLRPRPRIPLLLGAAIVLDVALMPRLTPALQLGSWWLVGEGVAIAACLLPGALLGWWMTERRQLGCRAAMQALTFAIVAAVLLPATILALTTDGAGAITTGPSMVLPQLALLVAIPGLSAVQEFVERGNGTPIPFDPPERLVTSGVYAYVANPMQLSMALCYLPLGAMLHSWRVALAALMSVAYSEGIARWDEDRDLIARAGADWDAYQRMVRRWRPRWKPFDRSLIGAAPARLYVDSECPECTQLGRWFLDRDPVGLSIEPASSCPGPALERITYDPGDGGGQERGVAAVARALEHLSLGWALVGMLARLPVLVQVLQFLTDASGGEPRARAAQCSTDTAMTRHA
jgi:protein-S-isoprenylcysteine O-methyltransferase Ste14